jgi:hypothetical protein
MSLGFGDVEEKKESREKYEKGKFEGLTREATVVLERGTVRVVLRDLYFGHIDGRGRHIY